MIVRRFLMSGLLLFSMTVLAEDLSLEQVDDFINKHYPTASINLSQDLRQQLTWLHDRNGTTASRYAELSKVLTRLYCLELLASGTRNDYRAFIAAQLDSMPNNRPVLSFQRFKWLSQQIKQLTDEQLKAIQVATVIASVTLTSKAWNNALEKIEITPASFDSNQFLAETISSEKSIYPLLNQFQIEHAEAAKWVPHAFPYQTHFRHMLYVEGGAGMFKILREKIKLNLITQAELDFWFVYWIINLSGGGGDLRQDGALQLCDKTVLSIIHLKKLLDEMLIDPNFQPLPSYLNFRGGLIGLNIREYNSKTFVLARVASMMQIFSEEQQDALQRGLDNLSPNDTQEILMGFEQSLVAYEEPTPTYAPAMFKNCLLATNGDVQRTVTILLPIYAKILKQYRQMRKAEQLDHFVPLCFHEMAKEETINKLLTFSDGQSISIMIDQYGIAHLLSPK